jgi:hypothetical protein
VIKFVTGLCKLEVCLELILCTCDLDINWIIHLATNMSIESAYNKMSGFIKEMDDYNTIKNELKQFLSLNTLYSVSQFSLLSFPAVQHKTLNHDTPTHRPLKQHFKINQHIDLCFHVTQTDPQAP